MSEPRASKENDDSRQSAATPLRRERAPTITIDTSAVTPSDSTHPPQVEAPSQPSRSANNADHTDTSALLNSNAASPSDTRSAPSVHSYASSDAREHDSRPTSPSPHHLSPTSKMTDSMGHSNYLSVPGARSRGNSIESEDSSNGADSHSNDSSAPGRNNIENPEEALQPDPGREAEFQVENNNFAFSPGQLNKLLNPKSLGAFYALGGLAGLAKGLRTDVRSGLSLDETELEGSVSFDDATAASSPEPLPKPAADTQPPAPSRADTTAQKQDENVYTDRKRVFGQNKLPEKKTKSILELAWLAYNDKVLILLTVAAIISLALGIYQSLTAKPGEPRVQWVEGVAIIVAILIVVVVGAANDWQKERQFVKLNKKKEDRMLKVIRSGKMTEISVHDLLVGDIMHLEPGDLVPVDGIYISGHNVKCDESSATGESDVLRKSPAQEVYGAIQRHENLAKQDPFIVSGAKVSEGVGTFLVTGVGVNSTYGKTMMSLQDEGQTTPLQTKLNVLAEYIAKLGLAAGLLLFVVLFIKFLAQLKNLGSADDKGQAFLQIFIVAVTVIVVAVPEGLPLAVTLALAFATTRMLKDNNLVRLLRACETMGNATTICSDKTGTLTENKMTAVAATLGTRTKFGGKSQASAPASNSPTHGNEQQTADSANALSPSEFTSSLSKPAKELLVDSIVLNSTAFEGEQEGATVFIGSKTETALLGFARTYLGLGSLSEARDNASVAQMMPFDSGRKCMAVVIKIDNGKKYRMLVKGASEVLLAKSTRIVKDPTQSLEEGPLSDKDRSKLNNVINNYATQSLRTIGLVYRDFTEWPPRGAPTQEEDRSLASFDHIFKDMVMFGVFGIQDPLRAGVTDSVRQCQRAGVFVRMVTGDNIVTAKAIAQECGIFTPGGVAIEGPKFRKLSDRQMTQIIPRLQVLARSSPDDKKILVSHLKKLGETVAATGDGTNDAQALKTADVGFSMGITGTEVAKEASDIILMDDNFASIVKAMAWGRTVNDAVKKFLQFQITVNITAVLLTFVSAVASSDEESVLTAVQLLWVNLIMDTFAALALATDPPSPSILNRRPEPKSAPLISLTMWKMIIGQSIYQLVVTLILNFAGRSLLKSLIDFENDANANTVLTTVVFNTFVWQQIFNQWNSRRLDNGLNIFDGVFRNWWFIGIQFIITGGQVLIVFVGGHAFSVTRLDGPQWAVCLILGVISLPVAVIIRCIPDEFLRKLVPNFERRKKRPELIVSDEDRRYEWNPALEEIRDQLKFFKSLRGGRMRNLAHKLQHPQEFLPRSRSGSRSRENSVPGTPVGDSSDGTPPLPATPDSRSRTRTRSRSNSAFGPAAAMAGIVAGSIAGWSPIERPTEGEAFKFDFNNNGGFNRQPGIEVHPDTAPDDSIVGEYSATSTTPPSQNPDLIPFFEHAPPALEPSSRSRRSRSRSNQSQSQSRTHSRSHSHSNSQSQL
ncbi:putative P-type calcium ATPase [Aspergillus undulatus]|uniref:putative P-type calcium ATPase n=1 Tax=Aspergillus undulatus TaxID=1810928 RepID=UPI003CCD87DA